MTPAVPTSPIRKRIIYPDSDGQPIADNTLQFKWIHTIFGGVDGVFKDDPNVLVAGDLLWYPVEGEPTVRCAPDVVVAFGRPKGERGSYKQWLEGNVPFQVVFEVLSPGNRAAEMIRKFNFYQQHGVDEYYIYDPDRIKLEGFQRQDGALIEIPEMNGWRSPRTGIRFNMDGDDLLIEAPDGKPFLTYRDLLIERNANRIEADANLRLAEEERLARLQAQKRGDLALQQAEQANEKAARLAEKLRSLGIDPDAA